MLQKRMFAPLAIAAGMLVVLTQFQNCSSLPSPQADIAKPFTNFTFSNSHLEVYDEASTISLSGSCEQKSEGANLQWHLLNNEGSQDPILSGEAVCANGSFQFNVTLKDDMVCGLDHIVRVQSPTGAQVDAQLIKRCQPLASAKLPGHCELEYNIKSEETGGRVCEKVCYASNRLVSTELRLENECDTLASTLAGQ